MKAHRMGIVIRSETGFMSRTTNPQRTPPTPEAIRRAIASSTAIETGQRVADLERKLENRSGKFGHITLAN